MELGLGSYAFRWQLGHSSFTPREPLTITGMIDATAEDGCTLLQIADNPELDAMSVSKLRELRDYATDRRVRLQCGSSGLGSATLERQLAVASELAADLVRIVPDAEGVHPSDSEAVRILTQWAPRYADAGIALAIENHFLTSSVNLRSILDEVAHPALGVCLDTANSIMVGEWPGTTFDLLLPYAKCVHLKDYAVVPDAEGVGGHVEGRVLGTGWLDIGSLLASLRANDEAMDGRMGVIIEQWLPRRKDEESTIAAEVAGRVANLAAARRYLAGVMSDMEGES